MTNNDPDTGGQEDAEGDRSTVTVPTHMSGDEVVRWKEVDAEWWEHTLKARDVNEQVVEMVGGTPGVIAVETAQGNEMIGGLATSSIRIVVDDEETADALSAPQEIEGIPITVRVGQIRDME